METQEELVNKIVVNVPPGKLGIHLVDLSLSGGVKITAVNHDSALAGKVLPGDKLVKINEVDCSEMNVEGRYPHSLIPFILCYSASSFPVIVLYYTSEILWPALWYV